MTFSIAGDSYHLKLMRTVQELPEFVERFEADRKPVLKTGETVRTSRESAI